MWDSLRRLLRIEKLCARRDQRGATTREVPKRERLQLQFDLNCIFDKSLLA